MLKLVVPVTAGKLVAAARFDARSPPAWRVANSAAASAWPSRSIVSRTTRLTVSVVLLRVITKPATFVGLSAPGAV